MYRVSELAAWGRARPTSTLANTAPAALHAGRYAPHAQPHPQQQQQSLAALHSTPAALSRGGGGKKAKDMGAPHRAGLAAQAAAAQHAAASRAAAARHALPTVLDPSKPLRALRRISDLPPFSSRAPEKKKEKQDKSVKWHKLPPEQRWTHVRDGIFPLVEANEPSHTGPAVIGSLAQGRVIASQGMSLLQGIRGAGSGTTALANLFRHRATVHRIIGCEADLRLEARRDNIHTAEVALVGRSNVGKSSLLNSLLVNGGLRKQLAQTSATPGRTQQLFMYSFEKDRNLRLVDCPGYGYADVSLQRVERWNVLMGLYLRKRARQGILRRVLVLVDARRGIGRLDEKFLQFLESEQIAYQVVLTKVDLLGPRQFEAALEGVRAHLRTMPEGVYTKQDELAAQERAARKERRRLRRMGLSEQAQAQGGEANAALGQTGAESTVAQQLQSQQEVAQAEAASDADDDTDASAYNGNSDDNVDGDDPLWASESGMEGASTSSLMSPDAEFGAFSCSVPMIHTVSSRAGLGLVGLQHSLAKMLRVEKNQKGRAYEPEGMEPGTEVGRLSSGDEWKEMDLRGEGAGRSAEGDNGAVTGGMYSGVTDDALSFAPDSTGALDPYAPIDDWEPEDDGMGNPDDVFEEDLVDMAEQFAPPIPVQHYEPFTKAQKIQVVKDARAAERQQEEGRGEKAPLSARASSASSSSFRSGGFGRARSASPSSRGGVSRFGRPSRRSFATSTRRARSSTPAKAAAAQQGATDAATAEAAVVTPKRTRAKKAATTPAETLNGDGAAVAPPAAKPKARKPRASKATGVPDAEIEAQAPSRAASAAASAAAASSVPATAAAASSPLPSSGNAADAHLAQIYQKKSQREHILARSETYIGSVHHQHSFQWVYAEERAPDTGAKVRKIVQKECVFVPALVHIFDEILVNAADNQHRVGSSGAAAGAINGAGDTAGTDSTAAQVMSRIDVWVDSSTGRLTVQNDGASIPVAMHPVENIPVPELIFGHLLTSSNYDDKQARFTGGRHGYGAKLTNIFSREFRVEIQDVARGLRFDQIFRNNMSERSEASITPFAELLSSGAARPRDLVRNYTRISFLPDYARFNEGGGLNDTTANMMRKRVIDVAACVNTNIAVSKLHDKKTKKKNKQAATAGGGDDDTTTATPTSPRKIKVYLDGELVDVDSFAKYLDLFPQPRLANLESEDGEPVTGKWVFGNINDNWQIAVGPNVATVVAPGGQDSSAAAAAAAAEASGHPLTSLPPATRDISFVNSICTSRGGTHVSHVSDKIVRALTDYILRAHRDLSKDQLPPGLLRSHMSLLVNCQIPNPSFSSQTKESLMTPPRDFRSECTLPQGFINALTAPAVGIVPAILDAVRQRSMVDLLRKQRARRSGSSRTQLNIPKLDDAHWAGSTDATRVAQTTLILTEGDSAKALVLSSLSILGREKYGVFPLKGKLLNVRDASMKAVGDNKEIQNILTILGLEIGAHYRDHVVAMAGEREGAAAIDPSSISVLPGTRPASRPLRYGRVMLMTDQDHDGSHIKGLFINLLHTYWPELLQAPSGGGGGGSFLSEFVTAIIKVRDTKSKTTHSFHTLAEFESWKASLPPTLLAQPDKLRRRYSIKYYKGLGTNSAEEGKEYFRNIGEHRVRFVWHKSKAGGKDREVAGPYARERQQQALIKELTRGGGAAAASSSSSSPTPSLLPALSSSGSSLSDPGAWIRLAFSKEHADARKEWLGSLYRPNEPVDTSSRELSLEDFINKELIVFSHADNVRSIPNLCDGLKPVQRKVLFGCFKRNLKGQIKVAQLSGYISEHTVYHHGEQSLQAAIIHMAQSFIGSNNVALLVGAGQFGSRNTGGKDAAAARYIFTALSPITRMLFPPADDPLWTYKDEDGVPVEPEYFVPVLPLVLINGAEGIGTGFSTGVPTFNPQDLIDNLRLRLRGKPLRVMHPWIRGFIGSIEPEEGAERAHDGSPTRYVTTGVVREVPAAGSKGGDVVFEITELASGRWPEEYKQFLAGLASEGRVKRVLDAGSDEAILLRVHATAEQARVIRAHPSGGALAFFKLRSAISLTNMHLFNGHGLMSRYPSALAILDEFAVTRLEYYRRRREHLLLLLDSEVRRAANKVRFIAAVVSDEIVVYKQAKVTLVAKLHKAGFQTALQLLPQLPVYADHTAGAPVKYTNSGAASLADAEPELDSYDYLLNMQLSALTSERLAALQAEHDGAAKQLSLLQKATPESLWLDDLAKVETAWNQMERARRRGGAGRQHAIEAEAEEDEQTEEAEQEAA